MKNSFWAKTLGKSEDFSLEARIFNAVCLASAVGLFFTGLFNLLLGISQLVVVMGFILTICILCYYYARFKMKLNSSVMVYMIASNILFILNFKYNSGINGPSLLIFMLSFFLTISVVSKKQYWFWIALNFFIVITLLAVEFKYPDIVINTYNDNKSRFIDFAYAYITIALFIFMVTTYIRKSYHKERELVEQKATELEQANETKNKLFSILAHDLRSPLASIQNYLEILSEVKLDEAEKVSIEKKLLDSTENTQQMLSNLLLWSKSQMEHVNVNLVNVNLKEVLKSTFQVHQAIAAEKGIELTDRLPGSIVIIADVDMLQLIVRNLINNAIKFTTPGGDITLSAEVINNDCRVMIKDNGLGIPYAQQNDIFSLKATSSFGTNNEKGVGLGLVLCKEFTELQGGKIAFESTPGVGTIFYLTFKIYHNSSKNNTQVTGMLINEV